jgi:signal transduction histidine kinase
MSILRATSRVIPNPTAKLRERFRFLAFYGHMRSAVSAVPPFNIAAASEARPERRFRLTNSKIVLSLLCLALTAALGYLDYRTGYEQTFLLFYLVPIALATWFGTFWLGCVMSILGVAAWIFSDMAAGIPSVGWWNIGMALGSYGVFTGLLAKLRSLFKELDQRVRERTEALRREIAERERLDREIAGVADRERRRLGQELHDSIGQHLTGTALTAETLRENLAARGAVEVAEADKVVRYIEEGIDLTRNLARGFFSPELDAEGLEMALQGLAENMSERFQAHCKIDIDEPVPMTSAVVATQLYRIAQEAVMNAVKHAQANRVDIRLARNGEKVALEIADDGVGFAGKSAGEGLGLRLMSHGAAMIGAEFRIERRHPRGTRVLCQLSSARAAKQNSYEPEN